MRPFGLKNAILLALLILPAVACGSSAGDESSGSGGTGGGSGGSAAGGSGGSGVGGAGGTSSAACTADGDCGAGKGCQPETGDSYCTKLCTVDGDCPAQQTCVGSTPGTSSAPKCKDIGSHGTSGVCDLYNGDFGPNTCTAPAGGECLVDGDCTSGEGCKFEVGDSYCTKLCSADTECPAQQICANGGPSVNPSCKEIGIHGASGVCDLYNGDFGPNTCK